MHPCGTREKLLTVASFRTWRGSQPSRCAGHNHPHPGLPSMPKGLYLSLAIRPRYSGLRVTGHRYLPVIAQPILLYSQNFLKSTAKIYLPFA